MAKRKGTPRNVKQVPNMDIQNISRADIDSQVRLLIARVKDMANEIDRTIGVYNTFIKQQKLPKEEDKEE